MNSKPILTSGGYVLPGAEARALQRLGEQEGLSSESAEALSFLADGNFGGMTVLTRLAKANRVDVIDEIRRRGMRGAQIWVGYKNGYDQDLERFCAGVLAWDPRMIEAINERCDNKLV